MDLGEDELELGVGDILPFLIYVGGILLVIGGAVLAATGGRMALPDRPTATGPGTGAAPPPPTANP
jgi:hypothetical protein